jgi:SAM-dependent methyltransferase
MHRSERERFFHDEVDIRSHNKEVHSRFWHVFKSPNSRRGDRHFSDLLRAAVPGRRVLEIGCGVGNLCQRVLEMGAGEVHGTDLSRKALEKARPKECASLRFFEHDAHDPLDGRYDVIYGKAILHHLNYREVLPRLYRDNLLPGGEMLFFEPLGDNLLMRAYWRLGSKFHTPDERPFLEDDLRWLGATFQSFQMKPFNYTTIPVGIVSSFLSSDPANWALSACDRIDSLLAERTGFLRTHFRSGIFHIRPSATTGSR